MDSGMNAENHFAHQLNEGGKQEVASILFLGCVGKKIVDAFTGKGWSAPLWLVQAKERDVLEEMTKSGPYAPDQFHISGLRAGAGKSKKAKEPKKEAAPNLEPIDGPPLDIYEDVDFSPGH